MASRSTIWGTGSHEKTTSVHPAPPRAQGRATAQADCNRVTAKVTTNSQIAGGRILSDILGAVRQCCCVILQKHGVANSEKIAGQITQKIAETIGGDMLYFPKVDREFRNDSIRKFRASGYSLDEISERAGCARSTVIRVLKSPTAV